MKCVLQQTKHENELMFGEITSLTTSPVCNSDAAGLIEYWNGLLKMLLQRQLGDKTLQSCNNISRMQNVLQICNRNRMPCVLWPVSTDKD